MQLRKLIPTVLLALIAIGVSAQTNPPPPGNGGGRPSQAGQGPGEHRGPPPEALAACQSHASGAACNFADREGKALSGTCFSAQPDRPLACRPARPGSSQGGAGAGGEPGQGAANQDGPGKRPPPAAVDACKGHASGAACTFNGRENKAVTGLCGSLDNSKPLACHPA